MFALSGILLTGAINKLEEAKRISNDAAKMALKLYMSGRRRGRWK
jgi:hypothetical protein